MPTTPRASKSLLMASINKNSLLRNTQSPRVIFVGGSNTCFGLNSQTVYSKLGLNPINTGIHALIGIKYMIDNTVENIKKGDIVVLIPEYGHYYRNLDEGSEELMRIIFDVDFSNIKYLDIQQLFNIVSFLPKYALSKYKITEYINIQESDVYSVNSFNKYGDTYTHWGKKPERFIPFPTISGDFNYEVIKYFEKYNEEITKKGAVLLVSFPCYQASSFKNSINQIKKIEDELNHSKLNIIGTAKRYMMPDSMMFNTPYHLTKSGVEFRTALLIEDLKSRAK
ncbi:hypothetical protein GCM10011514_11560 [Emticicia aquatilis]|uniref:Uncharacterized protein n=2 Tax=Emticicia aquatilis TaxID=1537369 RepID=A0A916YK38_9BACT|nr:hypothetical protein GCM10011514_11560 [Emticicia aquatilis]